MKKPNILYLMTDQQKYSTLNLKIGDVEVAPFYNEVAREGISFNMAYSNSPICTPSRATVMTGVHPLVHGVTCHQNRAPYNLKQLPEILMENGYYTSACGHYERSRNLCRGYHEQVAHDEPGILNKTIDYMYTECGRKDVGWSSGDQDLNADEAHAALVNRKTINMLDQIEASELPYFLHVAYMEPHPPYFSPKPYGDMFDIEDIELPVISGENRPKWQKNALDECGTDKASDEDIKNVLKHYYALTRYVNDQMQELINIMDNRGLLDNTWIIITSDHGDFTGEKGIFNKGETLYECILHVPLIILPPKNLRENYRGLEINKLVQLCDLFPTILGMADMEIPEYTQGNDLMKWIDDGCKDSLHDYIYSQAGDYQGHLKTTFPGGIFESGRHPSIVQSVRNEKFSYIHDPDYGDEAYNLSIDPLELNNIISKKPIHEEIKKMIFSQKEWEAKCLKLKGRLNVIPGDKGFAEEIPISRYGEKLKKGQ